MLDGDNPMVCLLLDPESLGRSSLPLCQLLEQWPSIPTSPLAAAVAAVAQQRPRPAFRAVNFVARSDLQAGFDRPWRTLAFGSFRQTLLDHECLVDRRTFVALIASQCWIGDGASEVVACVVVGAGMAMADVGQVPAKTCAVLFEDVPSKESNVACAFCS